MSNRHTTFKEDHPKKYWGMFAGMVLLFLLTAGLTIGALAYVTVQFGIAAVLCTLGAVGIWCGGTWVILKYVDRCAEYMVRKQNGWL